MYLTSILLYTSSIHLHHWPFASVVHVTNIPKSPKLLFAWDPQLIPTPRHPRAANSKRPERRKPCCSLRRPLPVLPWRLFLQAFPIKFSIVLLYMYIYIYIYVNIYIYIIRLNIYIVSYPYGSSRSSWQVWMGSDLGVKYVSGSVWIHSISLCVYNIYIYI